MSLSEGLRRQFAEEFAVARAEVTQVLEAGVAGGLGDAEFRDRRRQQALPCSIEPEAAQIVHGRRVRHLSKAVLQAARAGAQALAQGLDVGRRVTALGDEAMAFGHDVGGRGTAHALRGAGRGFEDAGQDGRDAMMVVAVRLPLWLCGTKGREQGRGIAKVRRSGLFGNPQGEPLDH